MSLDSPSGGAGAAGPLRRLSLRTKSLVIANEYTHRQMDANALREVLVALAPDPDEQEEIATAVDEELRAARYPVGEILRLMGTLLPGTSGSPAPDVAPGAPLKRASPASPELVVTRKVRTPHLMPFEQFEFEASPAEPPERTAAAVPAGPRADVPTAAPTRELRTADAAAQANEAAPKRKLRFTAGGETDPEAAAVEKSPTADGKPVVLVADDDHTARVIYRMKLEESGFAVAEAKDGVEAWKHIRGGGVHGVVMDMKMPGYHGLEVLSRMVDADIVLPVVVVSAFDQLENEFVVATYPRLTFLTKPAAPEDVTAAMAEFIQPGARSGPS